MIHLDVQGGVSGLKYHWDCVAEHLLLSEYPCAHPNFSGPLQLDGAMWLVLANRLLAEVIYVGFRLKQLRAVSFLATESWKPCLPYVQVPWTPESPLERKHPWGIFRYTENFAWIRNEFFIAKPQKFEGSLLPRHNLAYPDKNTPFFFKAMRPGGARMRPVSMSAGYLSSFTTSWCLSEKCSKGTTSQRYAYLPQNTWAPLGWRIWQFPQTGSFLGGKKGYMVKCQSPSWCQRDWQLFLVLLEYVSSWESINVLQASGGRMKASPVINSVSLLSSLRQKRELRWEEDSESCARGGMAKGPGDAGPGGKRTQWWLQDWVFF